MLRTLFEEIILPVLIFLLLRPLLFGRRTPRRSSSPGPAPGAPPVQAGGELRRDPVCGTYVSTAVSITKKVNGEVLYFCSNECRDRYKA